MNSIESILGIPEGTALDYIRRLEEKAKRAEEQSKFDRARIRILSQAFPLARINKDKINEEIHILNLEEEQWLAQRKDFIQKLSEENSKLKTRIQQYKWILARLQSEVPTQYPEQRALEEMMKEIEE